MGPLWALLGQKGSDHPVDRKGWGKDDSWRPEESHNGVFPRNETGFLVGPMALEAVAASSPSRGSPTDTKNRTLAVPRTSSPVHPGCQVRIRSRHTGHKGSWPSCSQGSKDFPTVQGTPQTAAPDPAGTEAPYAYIFPQNRDSFQESLNLPLRLPPMSVRRLRARPITSDRHYI